MQTAPNENVKLTFDQLQQIDTAKKILANVELEFNNAQRELKGIKMECERAIVDFSYREKLLAEIQPKIEESKKTLANLVNQVSEAKTTLEKCHQETKLINDTNIQKEQNFREKESKLLQDTSEHNKKVEEHNRKSDDLSKEKEKIEMAKTAFLKATETVTWN